MINIIAIGWYGIQSTATWSSLPKCYSPVPFNADLNFSFLSHVPLAFCALRWNAFPKLQNLILKLLKILSLEVEKLNILFKYGAIINCVAMETLPPMCSATCLLPIIQK